MIIKDTEFKEVAESVKPDSKKRVVLPKSVVQKGVTYHMYQNRLGQIVLDPQVNIPAYEAWLFKNPEAVESIKRGIDDARKGRVSKVNLKSL